MPRVNQAFIMTYGSDPDSILNVSTGTTRCCRVFPDFSIYGAGLWPGHCCLRDAGVTAHFTMGGHYASFEPEEILKRTRGLDSVCGSTVK